MKIKISLLSFVLGMLSLAAQAQNFFTYTTNSGAITITGYTGSSNAVTIPSSITGYPVASIGPSAFAGSTVTSLIIPASVTSLGDSAFFNCSSLTNMMFLGNAPTLGNGVFNKATSLTVYYYSDVPGWGATFGGRPATGLLPYTYSTNNNVITITGHLGVGRALTIPANINGYAVVNIGDSAFASGNLTNISIPIGVTNIGNHAFDGCEGLASINLPTGLTGIGQYAFYGSLQGANVTIPNSMTSIGDYAFAYSGISGVTIPNSVTNIGDFAFSPSGLTSATIPGSVKKIGYAAYKFCTGLTGLVISNGVTTINDQAFYQCESLTSITLPDSLTYLGAGAFQATAIAHLVIPKNVTTIDAGAFSECFLLADVVLPASVTSLGGQAFFSCPNLTSVTFLGNAPVIQPDWFTAFVPLTVYYYYGASGWGTNNFPETGWSLVQGGVTLTQLKWTPVLRGAGVQGGNFGFNFANTNGLPVVVEASANLVDWQPVWTNLLVGYSTNFVDAQWKTSSKRFYRAR